MIPKGVVGHGHPCHGGPVTEIDDADAVELARALASLLDAARHRVGTGSRSALVERITEHLGRPLGDIPNVTLDLPSWEHVNVHMGAVAYVDAHSPGARRFGVGGVGRDHQDLMDLLAGADQHGMYQLGAVDYTALAAGPDRTVDAVQLGFVATSAPDGTPVVLGVRGGMQHYGHPSCELRVLAPDRETATAVRDEVERLVRAHDVFRGAVLSFDVNEHHGNELISFLPRPELEREDVVLPDGLLDAIERHVVRVAAATDRLVVHGQHLKRGLLLHGPPGPGKTHTVRFLLSRLRECTVVVLSGRALGMIAQATAMVRRLQPSVLVIEDVDLIAQDRGGHEASPMPFELLNRIDGVDADADVTFVLTTNRVEEMERALVDRPGRVDLAVEVPVPTPTRAAGCSGSTPATSRSTPGRSPTSCAAPRASPRRSCASWCDAPCSPPRPGRSSGSTRCCSASRSTSSRESTRRSPGPCSGAPRITFGSGEVTLSPTMSRALHPGCAGAPARASMSRSRGAGPSGARWPRVPGPGPAGEGDVTRPAIQRGATVTDCSPRQYLADDSRCGLIAGADECGCLADAPRLSDDAIESRARDMFLWQQKVDAAGRAAARRGLDGLLTHARSRGPSGLVAELLRLAALLRIMEERPEDLVEVDQLLAEYTELAELDGDACRLAETAVLRAHKVVTYDHGDSALPDTAAALAILSDVTGPPPDHDPGRWTTRMTRTLNGLMIEQLKLGAHELADEVSQRATAVTDAEAGPVERLVHQLNRVRLQLSWALRLERGGRDAAAAARFVAAAQIAHVAARMWNLVRERPAGGGLPPVEQCTVVGAADALQHPGPQHLELLAGLSRIAFVVDDRILLAIATARCRMTAGDADGAVAALVPLRDELLGGARTEPVLALALHREFASVERAANGSVPRTPALARYASALEEELWALREARLLALRSHSEHHRLTREHGAVSAQALQDPLTGLPNRRALDLRLTEVLTEPMSQPCAVALIDLDRFKDVNDARSHAVGDRVLQAVAGCLRTALRAHDLVARYGGDEFVVVMPATPLPVARAALLRAAEAVASLPEDEAAGVTMSAGVVRATAGCDPSAVLAGADAAMYRAKRQGGNTVVIGAATTGEMPAGPVDRAGRVRRVMSGVASGPDTDRQGR